MPRRGRPRARASATVCGSARAKRGSGGRDKPSILADALEAVIGAVFLDGGWATPERVVDRPSAIDIDAAAQAGPGGEDHKTRLQEWAASRLGDAPTYEVSGRGPDHEKRFFATVRRPGRRARGSGEGRSKKQAEQCRCGQPRGHASDHDGRRRSQRHRPDRDTRGVRCWSYPRSRPSGRDLEREIAAKKIKAVDVPRPSCCRRRSPRRRSPTELEGPRSTASAAWAPRGDPPRHR